MPMCGKEKEQGAVEVEVMVMLPVAILSVAMLLYLSLFLFQRANLQACLETSLVYYKNTVTDTYVTKDSQVIYGTGDSRYIGKGNSYSATEPLNPYRGMFGDGNHLNSREAFEQYFRSVAGRMLFQNHLTLKIDYTNYVFLKQFEVTASQEVSFPLDLSALGIGKDYQITATARVAVVDHDSTIRNVDYAIDLLEDTRLGEAAKSLASKIAKAYEKLKGLLE
ncbi:hypothetical protein [uncultured Acetatifactor sp.]|jgi:hypothetical protein|uniref:hypothetical protein n=1 Tax=uncultured Acetatifactor sp. TaxID=1671927 RepID=UPI0026022BEC|nr:hypothetical protein [uncultured Acetatifactor sp.]